MRPDLFDLAHEAHHRLGLPIALATNGTIMDERVAQQVLHAGFRRVSMSFDGPDPQTHDRFRGIDGALYRVLEQCDRRLDQMGGRRRHSRAERL